MLRCSKIKKVLKSMPSTPCLFLFWDSSLLNSLQFNKLGNDQSGKSSNQAIFPVLVEKNGYRENGETRNGDSPNSFCYQHGETPYYQIRIRLQLVIQKPFCELLNVKLFKRQTPAPPKVLCKKCVLKSLTRFTGKHLCWSLFISGDSSAGVSL